MVLEEWAHVSQAGCRLHQTLPLAHEEFAHHIQQCCSEWSDHPGQIYCRQIAATS